MTRTLGLAAAASLALVETLSVSPVSVPSILALFVFPLMLVASPLPLVRPLPPILLMPVRRPAGFPLAPVSRRGMVVPRWYEQERARHELRSNDDPRAVVSRPHMPAAVREGPILSVVEEEVGGIGRRGRDRRHILDPWCLRHDDQGRRDGQMDPDVHVYLSVDRSGQGDS